MSAWNPGLYQSSHSFVWEFGRELIALLAPQPGERILDLGCGTGQLTDVIARTGAGVAGVDRSASMIREASANFRGLPFAVADAARLPFAAEFDAVFSNAVLHWVKDADAAAASIARALKPGGRFVAEFGGRGNVARLLEAVCRALGEADVPDAAFRNPWYFPSVGEYSTVLERNGLEVSYAALFDRLTPLEAGPDALSKWLAMFGETFLAGVPEPRRAALVRDVERRAAGALLKDGVWHADYRRLRIAAVKL